MAEKSLDFDTHRDALKHLGGKAKVRVQVLRTFRGIKHDADGGDPEVVSLVGFRKEISSGDTGKQGLPATQGEFVELACPTKDDEHGQSKAVVAAWAVVKGNSAPRIRFVSDTEWAASTKSKKPAKSDD